MVNDSVTTNTALSTHPQDNVHPVSSTNSEPTRVRFRCSHAKCARKGNCTPATCLALKTASWFNPRFEVSSRDTTDSTKLATSKADDNGSNFSVSNSPHDSNCLSLPEKNVVLSSSHYIVMASVGVSLKEMRPSPAVLDTGSGYNVIRRDLLPHDWHQHLLTDVQLPNVKDANGNSLAINHAVQLKVRFGSQLFQSPFLVADKLSCPLIVGTLFLTKHVDAIWCKRGRVQFNKFTVPLIGSGDSQSPWKEYKPFEDADPDARPMASDQSTYARIRLNTRIVIPPYTQVKADVKCSLGGLILVEPKHSVFQRYTIRAMNGVHEVDPEEAFPLLLSNFSPHQRELPRGMTIAYATRSPLALVSLIGPGAQELCGVLNVFPPSYPTSFTNSVIEDPDTPFDELEEKSDRASVPRSGSAAQHEKTTPPPRPSTVDGPSPPTTPDPAHFKPFDPHHTKWEDAVDLSHVSPLSLRKRIMAVLSKHSSMYSGTLGTIKTTEHRINLTPGSKPIHLNPYRAGPERRKIMTDHINDQLKAGVIEPAVSEWASPVLLVPKKDGTLRFCIDYRRLNAITIPDTYPLPRMDDSIDSLGNAKVFTTLDALWGYWQVPLAEQDRDKTTFTSHMGTYRYTRMPFGLRNAPATFQRALDVILSEVKWRFCLVYIDDIIVFSNDNETHLDQLDHVMTLLEEAGVKLKLKKCFFFRGSVEYLGHVISPGALSTSPDARAIQGVAEATFPEDIKQMRSFLGACNVYRRFIKGFAAISSPLTSMLKKDAKSDWHNPTSEQAAAFDTLKSCLVSPPILALPIPQRPYMIDCDASATAVGVVLLQQQDDSDPKQWATIGYFSKTLNEAQQNYSTSERECYAVVWAVLTLRPYVEGARFNVRTDHHALRWMLTVTDPNSRLMRWRLRLSEFDYEIIYRPGRVHQVPDALSRLPRAPQHEQDFDVDDEVPAIDDFQREKCMALTRSGRRTTSDEPQPATSNEAGVIPKPLVSKKVLDNEHKPSPWHDAEPLDDPAFHGDDEEDAADMLQMALDTIHEGEISDDYLIAGGALLPARLARQEILEAQRADSFCQDIVTRLLPEGKSYFFEDTDGMLCRRHPRNPDITQIVLPESLRARVCRLAHHSVQGAHPGQTKLHRHLSRVYYWPKMAADAYATVRQCVACAKNRLRLIKKSSPMQLFPATKPLENVAIDILGPLPKSKRGYLFILVITDRFTKLTQIVPLRRITAYDVAVAFTEHWVFKYGPPKTLLSDNGSQFVAHFFQRVCRILHVENSFTTTYHPQTNGQAERFNRTLLAMLRCYVEDHPGEWCTYAPAVCFAYNMSVHRSTGTTPFELVLSRPPPEFTLDHNAQRLAATTPATREDFAHRLAIALHKARKTLLRTQRRYKQDFDKRLRPNNPIKVGDSVFLNLAENSLKAPKLTHQVSGPFLVLEVARNTAVIQRGDVVERVSLDRVTRSPAAARPRRPNEPTPSDLAKKTRTGETWLFTSILEHREKPDGSLEFRVDWEGDFAPTWEPRENLPEESISRYLAQYRRALPSTPH